MPGLFRTPGPLAFLMLAAIATLLDPRSALAQDAKAEEALLLKNAEAFVAAFEKGDAKALAALFTPEGDYADQHGRRMKGREAIEAGFAKFFEENKGLKLRLDIGPIRLLAPGVAIEDGTAEVTHAAGTPPSRVRYTNVHVKKDGKWLIDSVRDAPYAAPSNYEKLQGLEWAIGTWVDEAAGPEGTAIATFGWSENQNYILVRLSTTVKNVTTSSSTQWIAWDPSTKSIRSWTFDAHGGLGEGTWTKSGADWIHKNSSTLRDGKKLTSTEVITRVDADTISWQSKDRAVGAEKLPDSPVVKMKRVKDAGR